VQIESPTKTKDIRVRIDADLYHDIEAIASDQKVSISTVVREALRRIIAEFECVTKRHTG